MQSNTKLVIDVTDVIGIQFTSIYVSDVISLGECFYSTAVRNYVEFAVKSFNMVVCEVDNDVLRFAFQTLVILQALCDGARFHFFCCSAEMTSLDLL